VTDRYVDERSGDAVDRRGKEDAARLIARGDGHGDTEIAEAVGRHAGQSRGLDIGGGRRLAHGHRRAGREADTQQVDHAAGLDHGPLHQYLGSARGEDVRDGRRTGACGRGRALHGQHGAERRARDVRMRGSWAFLMHPKWR